MIVMGFGNREHLSLFVSTSCVTRTHQAGRPCKAGPLAVCMAVTRVLTGKARGGINGYEYEYSPSSRCGASFFEFRLSVTSFVRPGSSLSVQRNVCRVLLVCASPFSPEVLREKKACCSMERRLARSMCDEIDHGTVYASWSSSFRRHSPGVLVGYFLICETHGYFGTDQTAAQSARRSQTVRSQGDGVRASTSPLDERSQSLLCWL